jgi:hypothetical protein
MRLREVLTTHIYRKYEDTDRYEIDVAINDYTDIFNEWDPAPFRRRDLHPDLQDFLEECSREITIKHPLAIVFYMPSARHSSEKEEICITGMRTHFAFNAHVLRKERKAMIRGVIRNMLIGLSLLVAAIMFDQLSIQNVLFQVLTQGLFIGGWVFIWEALSTLFFKNRIIHYKIKEWQRLHEAPIVFRKEQRGGMR